MTKKYLYSTCFSLIFLFSVLGLSNSLNAQNSENIVTGTILESSTNKPLNSVTVSVTSTGKITVTDDNGAFSITVPDLQAELIFNMPGYKIRKVYLNGRKVVNLSLVPLQYRSLDDLYNSPNGQYVVKNAVYSLSTLVASQLNHSKVTSSDQSLQGKIAGMNVIQQSGMPGHRTYMNLRGNSSFYGNSEPLLIIDGMIHDYNYANNSLMEGFALNPFDVLDIDDISDISVQKDGLSFLGSAGSNGIININTEQKAETSTVMKFSLYGGITLTPKNQDILDASEFKNYFSDMVVQSGDNLSNYPWLNGSQETEDYYRYNNNTNWQDEIYSPASLSKFHFFLKGGDEIATYNLSSGFLSQKGINDNSSYSRFNLRVNGLINITDKFSVIPNVKLSLADSKLANQGPSVWKNPITSALLKPSIMTPYALDNETGATLDYLDDVDNYNPLFKVSNPVAIVQNAAGTDRNYHFLSSLAAQYRINSHLNLYTLAGINFNNARENIFLPDGGIVQVDSAKNSPGDFVYEFRSTQNHSKITYTNSTVSGHNFNIIAGYRYLENSYKFSYAKDLNSASDDNKNLGDGQSGTAYLRSVTGDNRGLKWIAYYGIFDYNFRNKYYINANVSYDGNSAVNADNRYNLYPSVGAAWRVSSEGFMNGVSWIEDLKLRGSYSVTGNMYSTIYDYSQLYYTDRRLNALGTIVREIIPNNNMELEKRNTIAGGLDVSLFHQAFNAHLDVFSSKVDNMVILQKLPSTLGYTDYYDNGGKLEMTGIEMSADLRVNIAKVVWQLGGSVSNTTTKVTSLEFINPDTKNIITSVEGAQYITSVDNALNAFYGYKTDGILSAAEAGIIGPNGVAMQEGDVKYVEVGTPDGIIDESDKQIIGDPNPDLFGGFFTSFSFKRFELLASFNYSIGNDVFNYVRSKTEAMDSYNNQSVSVLDRWTSTNPSSTMPRASFGDPTGNTVFSDRWIEDGSYLRLGQLTLSYALPAISGVVKGVDIYVTATNLLTITNYSGYDPDFVYINSPFYMGIDYGKMPQTKSFVMGLKIDL